MTKYEKLVISAYTGVLMVNFEELHEFIEKKLGHPVWSHEFADPNFNEELQKIFKDEFLRICKEDNKNAEVRA